MPINEEYKPHNQLTRIFNPQLLPKIKGEITRLLKPSFIRTARYVEWLSNIVPVTKKNRQDRICIDFRNMNLATPTNEYIIPMAGMFINARIIMEY